MHMCTSDGTVDDTNNKLADKQILVNGIKLAPDEYVSKIACQMCTRPFRTDPASLCALFLYKINKHSSSTSLPNY